MYEQALKTHTKTSFILRAEKSDVLCLSSYYNSFYYFFAHYIVHAWNLNKV